MTATTIRVQMAQRKDTAANWTAANPILLSGEIGHETDTKKFKIGNGSTAWNSLAYLPIPDGSGNLTITGNLEIGSTGSLTFEGSTADGFETTLAVTNPTADRTITLPDVTGTVVTTGDTGSVTSTMIANGTIVDADISSTAEIAVSKLANGTANQVIVTDGTNVSWSDNLTLAGDLTVNGTTTTINTQDLLVEDKNIIIGNVATPSDVTADGGGITLKGATDKTINWVDATDAWTLSEHVNIASGKEYRIAGTKVLDATSLGSSVLITSANITDGAIVDGDISATAEIAVSKLADGTARQLLQTDAAGTGVEWASNIDIPGTLDVTGAATLDSTLSVPLGSAGSPSIYPGTDTNTGIYSPGANQLAISTDGTGRLFVDASGNVGVGITPSAPLDAKGRVILGSLDPRIDEAFDLQVQSAGNTEIKIQSGAASASYLLFGTTSDALTTGFAVANSDGALRVRTGNNERLRITSTGLVGAGTSSPNTRLHIADGELTVSTGGNVVDAGGIINFGTTTLSTYSPMATVQGLLANSAGTEQQGGLGFFTRPTGVAGQTLTRRMTITSTGLVGVGSTSPQALLHSVTSDNSVRTFGASGTARGVRIVHTTARSSIDGVDQTLQTSYQPLQINGSELYFAISDSERARIDSSGRLLVGTSTSITTVVQPYLQIHGTGENAYASLGRWSANISGPGLVFAKSRGGAVGTRGAVVNGDNVGEVSFFGDNGTTFNSAAAITASVDGTVPGGGTNDMPGRLVFSTTASGASSPTERLRITSAGVLQIADAGNISVGTTTGTKIGTATTQKLGFYNKTPVVQPTAVADATDAASVITQLNALLARMRDLGLIAT
jgi:hypothetical protein